ncbi:hypothetical protein HDU96_005820 [Phlyctochytrium bullatum]|nr:hypothetical protein HDU96_005820 [Phlyctochytrium bullatum]
MEDDHLEVETASQFSEEAGRHVLSSKVPLKNGSSAAIYTCLACHVAFHGADHQREHYRSDWHRYNLKRKVADLPPVSQETFAQRLKAQQAKATEAAVTPDRSCVACGKTYSSDNAYENHLISKKHKEAVKEYEKKKGKPTKAPSSASRNTAPETNEPDTESTDIPSSSSSSASHAPKASSKPSIPWRVQLARAKDEEEFGKILDQKIASAPRLDPNCDCLFCTHRSSSLEDNMAHMATVHSFFIPDLEYLVDLQGLIKYLGEKISVGNVCIYCNGKGRAMHSLEAVRDHMVSKGHCKIAYEDGAEDEIIDYYDFSSTWGEEEERGDTPELDPEEIEDAVDEEEGDGEEWEDVDEREDYLSSKVNGIQLSEDETRLTLASGRTVLHRSQNPHNVYHHRKQTGRVPLNRMAPPGATAAQIRMIGGPGGGKEALAIATRLAGRYAALGAVPIHSVRAELALRKEAKKQNIEFNRTYQDFRTRVGVRQNKSSLNQHFRSQIGFD